MHHEMCARSLLDSGRTSDSNTPGEQKPSRISFALVTKKGGQAGRGGRVPAAGGAWHTGLVRGHTGPEETTRFLRGEDPLSVGHSGRDGGTGIVSAEGCHR